MTVDENSLIWKWSWKIRFSHFLKAFYFLNRGLITRLLYVFLNNIFEKLGQWNNSYGLQMLTLRSVLLLGIFCHKRQKWSEKSNEKVCSFSFEVPLGPFTLKLTRPLAYKASIGYQIKYGARFLSFSIGFRRHILFDTR